MRHFTGECEAARKKLLRWWHWLTLSHLPLAVNFGWVHLHCILQLQVMPADPRSVNLVRRPQHPAAHGVLRLILELNGEEIRGWHAQSSSTCLSARQS